MNVLLYAEKSLRVDLTTITRELNRICKELRFKNGKSDFHITTRLIEHPNSYTSLPKDVLARVRKADFTFLFSKKQYYNNYFFETSGRAAIISLYGWEHLSTLSRNNGVVYFIAELLMLRIDGSFRHDDITGCVFDFRWNKTGIDLAMRNAFVCRSCLDRLSKLKLSAHKTKVISDLTEILDVVGKASKWNKDVTGFWKSLIPSMSKKTKPTDNPKNLKYDVFLAHNSIDKPFVEAVKSQLEKRGIRPWYDKDNIPPGRHFQDVTQSAIRRVSSTAIFFGKQGLGRWQVVELRSIISQCVDRDIPVIPVLLPGVKKLPPKLVFLNEFSWVKFSGSADEKEAIDNLVWGITGIRP
jgi:hypothetical protein